MWRDPRWWAKPLRISPLTREVAAILQRFLETDTHQLVLSISPTRTLQDWVDQIREVKPYMKQLRLPGLASGGNYGMMWTLRGLFTGANAVDDPDNPRYALAVSAEDRLELLTEGFPDQAGQVAEISGAECTTVWELFKLLDWKGAVQWFTMEACCYQAALRVLQRVEVPHEWLRNMVEVVREEVHRFRADHGVAPHVITVLAKVLEAVACHAAHFML